MRTLILALIALAFTPSLAEACSRCGYYNPCRIVKVVQPVVAAVPPIQKTDVLIVQNAGTPFPLVAPGATQGYSLGTIQGAGLQYFDVNRFAAGRMELKKADMQLQAAETAQTHQLLQQYIALEAPAKEAHIKGLAVSEAFKALGTPSGPAVAQQNAILLKRDPATGQYVIQAMTQQQVAEMSGYGQQPQQPIPDPGAAPQPPPAPPPPAATGKYPMLEQFCASCHGLQVASPKKGVYIGDDPNVAKYIRDKWYEITKLIETGAMPPKDHPNQPTREQRVETINELTRIVESHPK